MQGVARYRDDLKSGADRESVRRMFERDKKELRELGIPLETVEYSVDGVDSQGYHIRTSDFYLPYLRLLDDARTPQSAGASRGPPTDAVDIHPHELAPAVEGLGALARLSTFPLRREARSALGKLTFDLAGAFDQARPPVLTAADPDSTRDRVEVLTDAIVRRKRVSFEYRAISGAGAAKRSVDPWALLFKFNRWYLVGRDHDRAAERVFRVSRMGTLEPNTRRRDHPDFDPPTELDLSAWSGREAWNLPDADRPTETVLVRFAFPRSLWAERNGHGRGVGPPDADGTQERRFDVRQPEPFLRWLLTLEGDAEIVEPAALRTAFHELARRVASLYGATEEHDV